MKDVALPWGVEPIPGEAGRYYVRSLSRREVVHVVDLAELGFNGQCSCEAFQFTHLPAFREDRRVGESPRKHRCGHIRRALEYHAELTLRIMILHRQPQEKTA